MSETEYTLNARLAELKCCVVIPTYNNEKTLGQVITDTLTYTNALIVVNDGATDNTSQILGRFGTRIILITLPVNAGKGIALRTGFKAARERGYNYAITLDSDGQHFPSDLTKFLDKALELPGSLIIGNRNMNSENVPGGSSFGNNFSNFWFHAETGIRLPDTQSGYRLYPIKRMENIKFFTTRFEFEIEVLVKAAWRGIQLSSVPIRIFYARPGERISHFRPVKDFARISVLNTYLVLLAFSWHRPLGFFRSLTAANIRSFIKTHFFNKEESITRKSLSVCIGILFGILPIWGYQLIFALAVAYLLRLNKAIVILATNISIPPLLPFILLASLKAGELFTGKQVTLALHNISLQTVKQNLYTYLTGACLLAVSFSLVMGGITFLALSFIRKNERKQ